MATIIVLADMNTATIAGVSRFRHADRMPAASKIATMAYPVAHHRFWRIFRLVARERLHDPGDVARVGAHRDDVAGDGDVGAGADGDADGGERGSVVDAVAHQGHPSARRPKFSDLRHLAHGEHLGERRVDDELSRHRVGHRPRVAGKHSPPDDVRSCPWCGSCGMFHHLFDHGSRPWEGQPRRAVRCGAGWDGCGIHVGVTASSRPLATPKPGGRRPVVYLRPRWVRPWAVADRPDRTSGGG